MSTQPSWLTADPAVQAAAKSPVVQQAAKAAANEAIRNPEAAVKAYGYAKDVEAGRQSQSQAQMARASELGIDAERLAMIKRYHLVLRICYCLTAIGMGIAAYFAIVGGASIGLIFIAGYVCCFGCLLCCFEVGIGMIARIMAVNFGFLYSSVGRFAFTLFVSVLTFQLKLPGIIVMAFFDCVLALNLYVLWKYPEYETYLRKEHYEASFK
jgi:hypothetical protein